MAATISSQSGGQELCIYKEFGVVHLKGALNAKEQHDLWKKMESVCKFSRAVPGYVLIGLGGKLQREGSASDTDSFA